MKRLSIEEHKAFIFALLKGGHEGELDDDLIDPAEQPRRPLRSDKEINRVMAILDEIEAGKGKMQ